MSSKFRLAFYGNLLNSLFTHRLAVNRISMTSLGTNLRDPEIFRRFLVTDGMLINDISLFLNLSGAVELALLINIFFIAQHLTKFREDQSEHSSLGGSKTLPIGQITSHLSCEQKLLKKLSWLFAQLFLGWCLVLLQFGSLMNHQPKLFFFNWQVFWSVIWYEY